MKPGIHGVRTHWKSRFMALRAGRRIYCELMRRLLTLLQNGHLDVSAP